MRRSHLREGCRLLRCSVLLAILLAPWASGQQQQLEPVGINASPNVVGSGARALGMGGAFIAVADDATAASWNPGGLTQLERPEFSAVYSWKWLSEDFKPRYHDEMGGSHSVNLDDINYLSFVYPFRRTLAGRNFVISLNYQRKYDFDREFSAVMRRTRSTPSPGVAGVQSIQNTQHWYQEGGLSSLTPAFGFELTDRISLGLAVNFWDDSLLGHNEWKIRDRERFRIRTNFAFNGRFFARTAYVQFERDDDYDDFDGTNYTFGLLWKPTDRLSIGAVYHTKFSADTELERYVRVRSLTTALPAFGYERRDIRWEFPSAYGIGVAYRFPNDKLTLSLDVTRREWDEFVRIDPRGSFSGWTGKTYPLALISDPRRSSPITGLPKDRSYHKPTYTIRLGAEYVFFDEDSPPRKYLPSLRAGLMYDPEPGSGREDTWYGVSQGDGEPDDYYGATLGAGLLVKNRVNLDLAYQYRWGNNVRKDTFAGTPFETGFREDVEQHQLYLSTVVYF
jgi:long-subunit fatty acid transport protein